MTHSNDIFYSDLCCSSNDTSHDEHLDSSSYSWCLMRYAIVKYVRHSFITFLPQIGIELSGNHSLSHTSLSF